MAESSDSVSIDVDVIPFEGKVGEASSSSRVRPLVKLRAVGIVFAMISYFFFVGISGACGEDEQRVSFCVCLWRSGEACSDNVSRRRS